MTTNENNPKISILLITYNQEETIKAAVLGALAQTYSPLEIIVSDDASIDRTFTEIKRIVDTYTGPHTVITRRNQDNMGIGPHLSLISQIASGELLVVAAGDDISHPQRCQKISQAWMDSGKTLNLIASHVQDMDERGYLGDIRQVSMLQRWKNVSDWLKAQPNICGAAHAWSKKFTQSFPPLPTGVVGEDYIMVFRAIQSGSAATLDEVLVHYRTGGLSRQPRATTSQDVIQRWIKNAKHSIIELGVIAHDTNTPTDRLKIKPFINNKIAKEQLVLDIFGTKQKKSVLRTLISAHNVKITTRIRFLIYALAPQAIDAILIAKRTFQKHSH